jgi:para-nitrobenzyl esterase
MEKYRLTTPCGDIAGRDMGDHLEFRGIKYATAERWRYPEQITAWEGEYDATEYGACCYQLRAFDEEAENKAFYHKEFRLGLNFTYSEDCLFLNIWAPKNAEKCPVMIYVHGGSFTGGSGDEGHINGTVYAQRGIICVNFNYRLGPYGFCAHPDITDKAVCGNFGLFDQITAIKWVRDNIAAFGGDPDDITIAGESAGAMSVDLLISSPMTHGMFTKAIMMSGAGIQRIASKPFMPEKMKAFWDNIMNRAGAGSMEELRKLDERSLYYAWLEAQKDFKLSIRYTLPATDGRLVTRSTFNLSHIPNFPIMLGITENDMAVAALENLTKIYTRKAMKTNKDFYVYSFNRKLPGEENGPWHAADLLYAFATLDFNYHEFEEIDYKISEQMVDAFCAFIRTGNPNCDSIPGWHTGCKTPMTFCEDTQEKPWATRAMLDNTLHGKGAF